MKETERKPKESLWAWDQNLLNDTDPSPEQADGHSSHTVLGTCKPA